MADGDGQVPQVRLGSRTQSDGFEPDVGAEYIDLDRSTLRHRQHVLSGPTVFRGVFGQLSRVGRRKNTVNRSPQIAVVKPCNL